MLFLLEHESLITLLGFLDIDSRNATQRNAAILLLYRGWYSGSQLSEVRVVQESQSMMDAAKIMLQSLVDNGVKVGFGTSVLEEAKAANRGEWDAYTKYLNRWVHSSQRGTWDAWSLNKEVAIPEKAFLVIFQALALL